jgi:ELWxxDGT repeat protein
MGSTLFFRASDGTNGYQYQLWKSDGTDAGTVMVKDICPYADCFTVMGSTLFFSADDGTNGYELWKSDGTEGGTAMVKDINVSGSSEPIALTVVGSTLFFVANDGTNGCELWRSDGTGAGTVMVKDINPLGSSLFSADMAPNALAVMGSTLFFKATDGTHGYELWKSDATDAGTVMVKDINPSGLSSPYCLTVVDGTLFFFASDGIHDFELWRTNGTDAGTTMIKDINPSGSSNPSLLTVVGSTLVFAATDGTRGYELWSSDGTDAGTVMVRDINPGSGSSSPRCFVPMGSTLFFSANDGTHGFELWKMEAMTKYSVGIDIKPGSDPNSINPKSKGLTPVAILTAPGFDASTADPSTVELTGSLGSAFAVKWQMLDVPQVWDPVLLKFVGDGDLDLVLYFSTQELATSVLAPTDVEATLTGETTGGVPIEGADPVHIVKK